MQYRLTVIGESQAQLNNTLLREWLNRAGLSVCSGWPNEPADSRPEEVCFRELYDPIPPGVPILSLGGDIAKYLTGYSLPIHKMRGSILPKADGGWLVAAMNPYDLGIQKGQDHLRPHLGGDARRSIECKDGPRVPTVEYLRDPSYLSKAPGQDQIVSIDIEGANGRPNIVGVCWEEGQVYVFPWSEELKAWLTSTFRQVIPVFHNANFDVDELEQAGVNPPKHYYDTIVMAGVYDSSQPMNLQWQVLSHVPGSTCWKGLIDHEKGPDFTGKNVSTYRKLWTDILSRLHRPVPVSGLDWYIFYNGLDTAWGLALAKNFERKLKAQGRWDYYLNVMQPLQYPLLKMGQEGLPLDLTKLKEHQGNCRKWKEEAQIVLTDIGNVVTSAKCQDLSIKLNTLTQTRELERASGVRKFTQSIELTKLRGQLKVAGTFNPDSPKQLAELLYDYFELPIIFTDKGGRSVAEDAIIDLTSRVTRGTAKVKGDKDLCLKVLTAITAYNHWTHWEGTFLNPPIQTNAEGSSLGTTYSLHRTLTGRLTSGLDNSDLDKGGKRQRKVNLQNWPRELRDIIVAPEGYTFIGGDYSGIEWAIAMWMVGKVYNDGYHTDMLDRFYRSEFDPHSFLAGIAGCERGIAKIFTHGYNYDGSPRTLARNAGLNDSIGVNVCKAHDIAFRTRKWKDATVAKAKKDHKVQTPLGWRAYNWAWKPKPSEVLAWNVQGTAADLLKWVMGYIVKAMPPNCKLRTSTHDSFLLQVPLEPVRDCSAFHEAVPYYSAWLKTQMERPVPWLDGRSWRADIKSGQTWKDVS